MARKYHTLLERRDGRWCIEFGDYDKQTVVDERDDAKNGSGGELKRKAADFKIITTGDKQADIDAAVAKLNGA